MTGNDDRKFVVAVGAADRAHGGSAPDRGGNFAVAPGRAGRNRSQGLPDFALERRTVELHGRLEVQRPTAEIGGELAADLIQITMCARYDTMDEPCPQGLELALEAASIDEFEQVQPIVVRERKNGSKRRFKPLCVEAVHRIRLRPAGRRAEHSRKSLAKAASRFETMVQLQIDHAFSLSYSG